MDDKIRPHHEPWMRDLENVYVKERRSLGGAPFLAITATSRTLTNVNNTLQYRAVKRCCFEHQGQSHISKAKEKNMSDSNNSEKSQAILNGIGVCLLILFVPGLVLGIMYDAKRDKSLIAEYTPIDGIGTAHAAQETHG